MAVRYRSLESGSWATAQTRNIGVGGAFIAATTLLPVGTGILLELTLPPTGRTFILTAVVRWVSAQDGLGVQFVGVDVDVLLDLNDYFSSLEPGSTAIEGPIAK